ncbi:MAG: MotA/TolQ/ExbB proton channel family protein, partial [Candidatus Hydrogenedentes bacterium]|nr:MotA/TolQ/ExbB proton channel family protein [Candidatus Hydrogenedentota bacterium]
LERGLTLLEIVAGISPLIGLLGTVLGMVTVFDAITAEGIGNPQVLSNGISKALVTTVAGLCIAIPSLAFHSYFSRRVESLAMEMQDVAMGFITKVRMPAPRPSKEVAVETMPFAEPQA